MTYFNTYLENILFLIRFSKIPYKKLLKMFETNDFINICTDIENNYKKYFNINILKKY